MENKGFMRWLGYSIVRIAARFYVIFAFKSNPKRKALNLDTPFVLVCNHQTDFDLALMICSIKERITPVASEHVLHMNIAGPLIRKCLNPITVIKGSVKVSSVRQMLKSLRNGSNLMIHPEGARTFDGRTMEFGDELGKVIKTSKAALVTYTVSGGFLKSPRWALYQRRGKVTGKIVNIYTAEMLKKMNPDEIAETIKKDIYVNDYEAASGEYIAHRGAEGIGNFIFICPECRKVGTLRGEGNKAVCECGFTAELDSKGRFNGKDMIYWGEQQKEQFAEMYSQSIEFSDEEVTLERINSDSSRTVLEQGRLTGTADGISIGKYSFLFEAMEDEIEMIKRGNTAVFTVDKVHYNLTGEAVNMYKYWLLCRMKLEGSIS